MGLHELLRLLAQGVRTDDGVLRVFHRGERLPAEGRGASSELRRRDGADGEGDDEGLLNVGEVVRHDIPGGQGDRQAEPGPQDEGRDLPGEALGEMRKIIALATVMLLSMGCLFPSI